MQNYLFEPMELRAVLNSIAASPGASARFEMVPYPPFEEKGIRVADPDMSLERFVAEFVNDDTALGRMAVVKKDRRDYGYFRWKVVQRIKGLGAHVYTYDINEHAGGGDSPRIVFAYGTLRTGFYFHGHYGLAERSSYWGRAVLRGARMFDLGSYPCVVLTGREDDVVHGELLEMLDPDCARDIELMETQSGYEVRTMNIGGCEADVYVFGSAPEGAVLVKDGLWKKREY